MGYPMTNCKRIWAAATLIAAALPFQADAYGVKSHARVVLSVNPGSSAYDLRQDTGWQTNAPATIDISQDTTGAGGATLSGDMHLRSAYGDLRARGSGAVTNSSQTGAFEWQSSYIGGEPNAWFQDRLTIVSDTLAPGTPVTLAFGADLLGGVSLTPPAGQYYDPYRGLINDPSITEVTATLQIQTLALTVGASTRNSYPSFQTGTLDTTVGSTINIWGKLWVDVNADANTLGPILSHSFSYDTRLLTAISLSPGADYIADSQTRYVMAVPEPAAAAEMLAGLFTLFTVRRQGSKRGAGKQDSRVAPPDPDAGAPTQRIEAG